LRAFSDRKKEFPAVYLRDCAILDIAAAKFRKELSKVTLRVKVAGHSPINKRET
jgi:hypothetical protein